jgi:putative Mn2+ efflux pump MntP
MKINRTFTGAILIGFGLVLIIDALLGLGLIKHAQPRGGFTAGYVAGPVAILCGAWMVWMSLAKPDDKAKRPRRK